MDPRVREHAEIVADHCTDVGPGDDVLVRAPAVAEPLVVALHEVIGERGGRPALSWVNPRAHRAYMRAVDPDAIDLPEHVLAFVESADAVVDIGGSENVHERADVPPEAGAAFGRAIEPIHDASMDANSVYTQYPASGDAQKAEMSTAAYEDFVWDAVLRDWAAVRDHQQRVVEVIEAGDEVRVRAGETTDVRMRLGDNPVGNDAGEDNLPGGEVYTAPLPDSVEGVVEFDLPAVVRGREIRGVRVRFEDGEVVEASAEKNGALLGELLDTDAGARRVGELGIGMNRDVDRFTYNMLFDEKMGDTVHLALGRAYEETVADGNERNESAIHRDLLVDVSEDSTVAVDGEVIQRDGTFWFEDGFDQ